MAAVMEGPLANLSDWKPEHCSLVKALEIVGTRSALMILREAYYGTTRFSAFAQRIGITERVVAGQLRHLTEAGLLHRRPYRDEGGRTRDEYVLTAMGRDLLPAVLGLMQWGDKYLHDQQPPLLYVEHDTGAPVTVELRSDTGHKVELDNLGVRLNPVWRKPSPPADTPT
ncbi:winged helix-turn-helix transcriptional regulator [Spirillospora sp. CA-294931]|uniref:winged helix-turn-helix transcriptional regulator n=1 Tax=Spirillospora sp. CA-294931 TaxID=3240042 RepID=UPI003D912E53